MTFESRLSWESFKVGKYWPLVTFPDLSSNFTVFLHSDWVASQFDVSIGTSKSKEEWLFRTSLLLLLSTHLQRYLGRDNGSIQLKLLTTCTLVVLVFTAKLSYCLLLCSLLSHSWSPSLALTTEWVFRFTLNRRNKFQSAAHKMEWVWVKQKRFLLLLLCLLLSFEDSGELFVLGS